MKTKNVCYGIFIIFGFGIYSFNVIVPAIGNVREQKKQAGELLEREQREGRVIEFPGIECGTPELAHEIMTKYIAICYDKYTIISNSVSQVPVYGSGSVKRYHSVEQIVADAAMANDRRQPALARKMSADALANSVSEFQYVKGINYSEIIFITQFQPNQPIYNKVVMTNIVLGDRLNYGEGSGLLNSYKTYLNDESKKITKGGGLIATGRSLKELKQNAATHSGLNRCVTNFAVLSMKVSFGRPTKAGEDLGGNLWVDKTTSKEYYEVILSIASIGY